ncbi:hypothetical protein OESDEN_14854 [Oesophagostomum dentatum]|uniref:F-box domain-containing protein n=1 Tax=Oesophagostomum dentatum TaxID=61180 RepID=A0A0B1SNF1_OESDE|nr:hypothetical protein OESDEN_14854 [Oesophagostomum dentatum]
MSLGQLGLLPPELIRQICYNLNLDDILNFGNDVSTLSNEEIQQIIAQYAPYLNDTRQLQHLILDLSHSKLLASELEKLYTIVSLELPQTHRISLYTSECLPEARSAGKQKFSNRVACS